MYEYRCKFDGSVDGDTVDVIVDLGFETYRKMRIRMLDIDTPEEGEPGYDEATAFVENWFAREKSAIVRTVKMRKTNNDKKDSFGRYLGRFYHEGTDLSLNKELLRSKLAVPYER